MAYDILKGRTPGKNYAIQGHPPIHSFEYVFSAGGYCKPPSYAPPARRWHPAGKSATGTPLDVSGLQLYEISNTDWEAAVRYMNNLAENVKYTRQVHGDKILSQAEAEKWATLWSKWLLFSAKIETVKTAMQDESLATRMLNATIPLLWPSRLLFATARGSLALMSPENKRELDGLLKDAHALHDRFRLLGMNQVAIPYMGDLVVILRSLPRDVGLVEMAQRLRDGAKVGDRLLDENTAWWQWRKRNDTKGLRTAIADSLNLAAEIVSIAAALKADASPETKASARATMLRLLAQKTGKQEPSLALREKFIGSLGKVYAEAAALYGVEEVRHEGAANLNDDLKTPPGRRPPGYEPPGRRPSGRRPSGRRPSEIPLWAWGLAGVAGYAGFKWWAGTGKKDVVEIGDNVGYHPYHTENEKLNTEGLNEGDEDEF